MGRLQVVSAAIISVLLVQLVGMTGVGAVPTITSQPAGNGNFSYRMFGGADDPARVSDDVARNYDVFLLSPSHVSIATKIKSLNSRAVVYMYKDASSTRINSADPQSAWCSGNDGTIGFDWGVDYCDTDANHPDWFLTVGSNRFEYDGYPYHWHTDVGATGYKEKWTSNVIQDLQTNTVWDGVFVDNQLVEITAYTPSQALPDQYATIAEGQTAYTDFIDYAGAEIGNEGYGVISNMSNARLYAGLWDSYSAEQTGGFDEFWTTFGGSATSANNLGEYSEGWGRQMSEVDSLAAAGKMGIFSAQTSSGACNDCALYGYASYLLANNGQQVFIESNVDNDGANYLPSRAMYGWQLGAALGGRTELQGTDSHLFMREFENGQVFVNASYNDVRTVTLDEPLLNEEGQLVTSVTIDPLRATILRRQTPPQPPETETDTESGKSTDKVIRAPNTGAKPNQTDKVIRAPNTGAKPNQTDSDVIIGVGILAGSGLAMVAARLYRTTMLR